MIPLTVIPLNGLHCYKEGMPFCQINSNTVEGRFMWSLLMLSATYCDQISIVAFITDYYSYK
jgi:hypothetical protein